MGQVSAGHGKHGSSDAEFDAPAAVAVHGGELYVADCDNNRVQVFAPNRHGRMRFARVFGGEGHAPGRFHWPMGLAFVRGLLSVVPAGWLRLFTVPELQEL